jgi:hypothetical protein
MIDVMKQALEALDYAADIVYSKKDDDIIGVARKSLRQAIEEAEQWDTSDMAHRSGGLSVEEAEKHSGKCGCGANLYVDENGKPCSKVAKPEQEKESTAQTVDPRVLLISNGDFTKETGNRLCDIERRLAVIETQPDEATSKKPHAVSYKDGVPVAHYNFDPPPYTAPPTLKQAQKPDAELRRLHEFELAHKEWIAKTDWMKAAPFELGMHKADALKHRIDRLHEVNQELVKTINAILSNDACIACKGKAQAALAKARGTE